MVLVVKLLKWLLQAGFGFKGDNMYDDMSPCMKEGGTRFCLVLSNWKFAQ